MRALLNLSRIPSAAAALGTVLGVWLAGAGLSAAPALAVSPSPPPGAPAVESAPSSLVGLDPQLPASVVSASAAPGSHWKPEKAAYGTASTNDIASQAPGGTTIRVNEIYPTTASGSPAKGPFPVLADDDAVRQGPGRLGSPGSAASPSSGAVTGGADNYLAQRGFIEVVEDVRGTGDSNGSWGLFDPVQQQDAIRVLIGRAAAARGRAGGHLRAVVPGHRPAAARRRGRSELPVEGHLPMVSANDIYRDTSFMGGLLDFEFSETYLGLTAGPQHRQPGRRCRQRLRPASDLAGYRERPRLTAWPATTPRPPRTSCTGGRRGVRRLLLAGPQSAEHPRGASSPTTSPPTWSAASSTSSRTASR